MLLISIATNCVYLMCILRSIFCIAASIHDQWKFLLKDLCRYFQRQFLGKWHGQQNVLCQAEQEALSLYQTWHHWSNRPGSWSRHPVGYLVILSQLPAVIDIALGAACSWLYIIFPAMSPSYPSPSPSFTHLHTATPTLSLTDKSHNLSENVNFKLAWNLLECKG